MYSKHCVTLLGILVISAAQDIENHHKKRQIYREHVLPHAGGRIPDTAFQTDRLYLNRLQKDGVSVPDGVVTEQRSPQVYPFLSKPVREVYHVALTSDGRFTAHAGRYHHSAVPSIETTYLYPQIHGQPIRKPAKTPFSPVYKDLHLPRVSDINQVKLQAKNSEPILKLLPIVGSKANQKFNVKTQSFQNFNVINDGRPPTSSAVRSSYRSYFPDYDSTRRIFNDFDAFFNNVDLHGSAAKTLNSNPLKI